MELVYTITRKGVHKRDWRQEETTLCRISSSNIIAFCSTAKLDVTDSDFPEGSDHSVVCQYHVYVCDIDKPWQVHRVVSCREKVVAMEWHVSGTRLLIASGLGKCQIWHMKNFLLNRWEMKSSSDLPGEEVIAIAWFHHGSKTVFNGDKKESQLYLEKITKTRCTPTVSQFGSRALDGWIAVTASGLVGVAVPAVNTDKAVVKLTSLTSGRVHMSLADIAFSPAGSMAIVTSDGQISSAIQCFTVTVQHEHSAFAVQCKVAPSFHVKCHKETVLKDSHSARISHLKFLQKDSTDAMVVAAGDQHSSHVELWHLCKEQVGLHRMYQTTSSPVRGYEIRKWQYKSSVMHSSLPISLALPRFPIHYPTSGGSPGSETSHMFQYCAIAYKDGSVKLVNKASFLPMATTNLDTGLSGRVIAHLSAMEQTASGCALVGIDQLGTLYVMKVVNTRDPVTQVPPLYLVGMLEYALVAGYDWWDVLIALRTTMMEGVCEKLADNFSKQPPVLQELYQSRFLALKGWLYRCSSQQQRAADSHAVLVLQAIRAHCTMILRPKGLSATEMGPVEKLSLTCQKTTENDLDNIVVSLNPEKKEFVVESSTLQALQPLLQWVAELSLYLLSAAPSAGGYSTWAGATLLGDVQVLATLRELLLLAYIWGLITPSCLPHVGGSQPTDCMKRLFSLLTQLWVRAKESPIGRGGTSDLDDTLLDECCLLASHLVVPQLDQGLFGGLNYQRNIFLQPQPVKFAYGETPAYMSGGCRPTVFSPDGQPPALQNKDIVRLINLGNTPPHNVKVCARCGCFSLLESSSKMMESASKMAAVGSWEGKWVKHCLCGGRVDVCATHGLAHGVIGRRLD